MKVLVTNDDGVDAPGLQALAGEVFSLGHDVVVAAPMRDHSGYGAALGPIHVSGQVAYETRSLRGHDAVRVYAVDGPPALASLCGCLGGFGARPDVVLSGINAGANTGRALLHSGTVGAALTAAQLGVPAAAVSLDLGREWHWATAATIAAALVDDVAELAPGTVLNLNVPNRSLDSVVGVQPARIRAAGTVQAVVEEPTAGVLQLSFDNQPTAAHDSDDVLLAHGWVTATLVRALDDSPTPSAEILSTLRQMVTVSTIVA